MTTEERDDQTRYKSVWELGQLHVCFFEVNVFKRFASGLQLVGTGIVSNLAGCLSLFCHAVFEHNLWFYNILPAAFKISPGSLHKSG